MDGISVAFFEGDNVDDRSVCYVHFREYRYWRTTRGPKFFRNPLGSWARSWRRIKRVKPEIVISPRTPLP
jgi:hypothetical protein